MRRVVASLPLVAGLRRLLRHGDVRTANLFLILLEPGRDRWTSVRHVMDVTVEEIEVLVLPPQLRKLCCLGKLDGWKTIRHSIIYTSNGITHLRH